MVTKTSSYAVCYFWDFNLVFWSEHMLSRCPASACFAYLILLRALLASRIFSIRQRVCVLGLCADMPVCLGISRADRALWKQGTRFERIYWFKLTVF